MILALDAGNTHIVFGCVNSEGIVGRVLRIATDHNETSFGYAAKMMQIFQMVGESASSFSGSVLSCVVPSLTETLKAALVLLVGKEPLIVGAGVKTGLKICIDDPGTMAADLVATAVAAKEDYALPCVVIDMGTATTLTVLDREGRYLGGSILPGVGTGLEALIRETSLLPRIRIAKPRKAISASTEDSMRSGVLYGAVGALDGILDRFAEELGQEPACIVSTGGLANEICPLCRHKILYDEKLLLRGLGILYRKNCT